MADEVSKVVDLHSTEVLAGALAQARTGRGAGFQPMLPDLAKAGPLSGVDHPLGDRVDGLPDLLRIDRHRVPLDRADARILGVLPVQLRTAAAGRNRLANARQSRANGRGEHSHGGR